MESPTDAADQLELALELHRKSLRLVPLRGKTALLRDWPDLHLGENDIRAWTRRGINWGIITGDPLVVLDTDTEAAEAWVRAHGIESPVVVRSGGGGLHRYFRCPEHLEIRSRCGMHRIEGLDVKGWRSYVVAPCSIHPRTRERYAYVPGCELGEVHELPFFDPAWIREVRAHPALSPIPSLAGCGPIRNVRAYIRGILSVEGQGGDRACFTVACLLAEAGLNYDEMLAELDAWNQECALPLWSDEELARKARYALERVRERQQPERR